MEKMTKDQYGKLYTPTPEELKGESWVYCYSTWQPAMPTEVKDEHSQ